MGKGFATLSRCKKCPNVDSNQLLSSVETRERIRGIPWPTELPEGGVVTFRLLKLLSKGLGKAHGHGYSHVVP